MLIFHKFFLLPSSSHEENVTIVLTVLLDFEFQYAVVVMLEWMKCLHIYIPQPFFGQRITMGFLEIYLNLIKPSFFLKLVVVLKLMDLLIMVMPMFQRGVAKAQMWNVKFISISINVGKLSSICEWKWELEEMRNKIYFKSLNVFADLYNQFLNTSRTLDF